MNNMMIEHLNWLLEWINENILLVIWNSHAIFWNGNFLFFFAFIVSLTVLLYTNKKKSNATRLFAAFALIALLTICYNPITYKLVLGIPQTNEAVFGRIWVLVPAWMIIAYAGTELIDRNNSSLMRNSLCFCFSVGIVLAGLSPSLLGYFIDSSSAYKVNEEGIEIADKVLSINANEPTELLVFCSNEESAGSFIHGGTTYCAIQQYTGQIGLTPIIYDEQSWNNYFLSENTPDGEETTVFLSDLFDGYRRKYDFSYVVMPSDESIRGKMLSSGYQYITSTDNYDIYAAIPLWCIQSYSYYMEDGKKVYVLSDNMGHYIVVGGGTLSDRRQLQRILLFCGNHVDMWILLNPSAGELEGFNSIVASDYYTVDKVYIPAIDVDSLPDSFMKEQDLEAYEGFLRLAEEGTFDLCVATEGDEIEMYGMRFQVLSDMLDVQCGSVTENSMLFRMIADNQSFLFCSYIGYAQGQIALEKYGDMLNSDYVQISSGMGAGLGQEFYNTVSPDIAFCDSITDDAGRQTYDMLISNGITCYCIENNDPNVVMIE